MAYILVAKETSNHDKQLQTGIEIPPVSGVCKHYEEESTLRKGARKCQRWGWGALYSRVKEVSSDTVSLGFDGRKGAKDADMWEKRIPGRRN